MLGRKPPTIMAFIIQFAWVYYTLHTTRSPDVCMSFESNLVISCEKVISEFLTR